MLLLVEQVFYEKILMQTFQPGVASKQQPLALHHVHNFCLALAESEGEYHKRTKNHDNLF